MRQILLRVCFILMASCIPALMVYAQDTTTSPGSVDPELLNLQTSRVPKEYTIAGVTITGIHHLDTSIILSGIGIHIGDRVLIPGSDIFSKSIQQLWRQKFFSDVQIYFTRVQNDHVWIGIYVHERPLLANFKFIGASRTESEELQAKLQLTRQTIITENLLGNIRETGINYYRDKGFRNARIMIHQVDDSTFSNSKGIMIYIDKGHKVLIDEVRLFGNDNIDEQKIKKQLKGTKERTRLSFYPSTNPGPYGIKKRLSFKEYVNEWGLLSVSKTKRLLDPYFRLKLFSSAKFNETKYEEDKERLIKYYNSLGYRDVMILDNAVTMDSSGRKLYVDININEGKKYYFGNIAWKGNARYPDSLLNSILGISQGDVYNVDILNKRLGKELSQEGRDISGYYMDDGFLFFRAEAVETAVYNDTIDHEIRIIEGVQARINRVSVAGNDRTKDHVILRELTTIPGDLFRRIDIIRSTRELGALQYFNPETINPGIVPDAEKGTVDINWRVEEKSSDQFEFSAGWGGGNIGVTGTLGLTLNNISLKKFFDRKAWDPFPQGDGQKLSVRFQSTARTFHSYNFSFTEPWLGGKKRNSLTLSFYKSKFSSGVDPVTGLPAKDYSKNNYLKTWGASVSLGKQLKWPDDFFSIVYSLNYTRYKLKDYLLFDGLNNGVSNNFSFKIALNRNSTGPNPYYPTTGSNFTTSAQVTLPYSLLNPRIAGSENAYKNPEYHKWRFGAEWYMPVGKPTGTAKDHQLVIKMAVKYGFMGRYNNKLDYSPFERFQLGDAGLTNNFGLLGYDIIAHRGYPVYASSDPSVNPDQPNANKFFTIFNKYQLEMRYPIVMNQSSTIYGLAFFEAANGWYTFKDYNPFRLRRSAGVGMRFYLPMIGLLGFDYGVGLDRIKPGNGVLKNSAKFTITLGIEPE